MEKKELKKLMWGTCFGLSYCCSLEKECYQRDEAIKRCGLTEKDFVKLKEKFDDNLIKIIEKKSKGG